MQKRQGATHLVPSPEVDGATATATATARARGARFVMLRGGQEVRSDRGERVARRGAGAQVREQEAGVQVPDRDPRIHLRPAHLAGSLHALKPWPPLSVSLPRGAWARGEKGPKS